MATSGEMKWPSAGRSGVRLRGHEQPVAAAKTRPAHLALEDLQLVAKDHQLDIRVRLIGRAGDKLDRAAQEQVHEREEHGQKLPREGGTILRTRWPQR
jgi:hypothetical protein